MNKLFPLLCDSYGHFLVHNIRYEYLCFKLTTEIFDKIEDAMRRHIEGKESFFEYVLKDLSVYEIRAVSESEMSKIDGLFYIKENQTFSTIIPVDNNFSNKILRNMFLNEKKFQQIKINPNKIKLVVSFLYQEKESLPSI